jgi:predicted SprT family Zn-dependent metalloprotease
MSKKEVSISSLSDFLPQGTFELVEPFLLHYKVHLTITKSRATVLGDYRNAIEGKAHRISVNGNLNQYAFLITLLHELAHLITYVRFGKKVASHGREWKNQFSDLLKHFIQSNIFPQDIRLQIAASMKSPAASSCADDALRVLRKYDAVKENHFLVEEIEQGQCFQTKNGKLYKREEKIRKRIRAIEVDTGRVYLFSPIYEVMKVN